MNEPQLKTIIDNIPNLGVVSRTEYALVPMLPVPKQSVQFTRGGFAFTPAKKKQYVKDLRGFIRSSYLARKMTGKIRISLLFCFPWRKADKKKTREPGWAMMDKRPDIDNLMKPFFDACNDLCFDDDGQIVTVVAMKIRHEDPAIVLKLEELEGDAK